MEDKEGEEEEEDNDDDDDEEDLNRNIIWQRILW
jgi:hypothetical protein